MKKHNAGVSGKDECKDSFKISELKIDKNWIKALIKLIPSDRLRPVQKKALIDFDILNSRRNLVVSAPTNSGKTLIKYFILIEAVRRGSRVVLVEPLRALAQEKANELQELLNSFPEDFFPEKPEIKISTGDYRLENENFQDAPPDACEFIVATPERFEAILRSENNSEWIESIGAVCIDEAHLIGDYNRGLTLEFLIGTLKSIPSSPRIALFSATIGGPENLQHWLNPCDLIIEKVRTPSLVKEIYELEEDEKTNDVLLGLTKEILEDEKASILIFVYRKESCSSISKDLTKLLSNGALALPYNSVMNSAERARVRNEFLEGKARCIVATTALAMGVNLPATHVIIRDTTFWGVGQLPADEIIQMLGRAGRGNTPGHGIVIVQPNDKWDPGELTISLKEERIKPIGSSLEGRIEDDENNVEKIAEVVAALLSRFGAKGCKLNQIKEILSNMLAGEILYSKIEPTINWLEDGTRLLAYKDEHEKYYLTVLGQKASASILPLSHAAGLGQLIRDLLDIDSKNTVLSKWTALDHIILIELLSDRSPSLRKFSESLAEQIDGWMEGEPQESSILFNEWIRGKSGFSKAEELLGSLNIPIPNQGSAKKRSESARKTAYLATMRAIVLFELSKGETVLNLSRKWNIQDLGGVQEKWRDMILWLLGGQSQLFDLRCFYYHLKEISQAVPEQILNTKKILRRMQLQAFELSEKLKYCSPLGPILYGTRRMLKNSKDPLIGHKTIKRLEDAGYKNLADLANIGLDEMQALGIRRIFAKQIKRYIRRRSL
tara:strand:- start:4136 stop:6478 length:2343 start_codon:yes stop_codon:yes gene_type:complete